MIQMKVRIRRIQNKTLVAMPPPRFGFGDDRGGTVLVGNAVVVMDSVTVDAGTSVV